MNRDECAAAARCTTGLVVGSVLLSALALLVGWWAPAALVATAGALTAWDVHRVGRL